MTEVYYIEDDKNIAMLVKKYLEQKGYIVSVFQTLSEGKHAFECHIPGIVPFCIYVLA